MSIVARLLGLGAGYGRQAISRVLPTAEERILGNLRKGADEMLSRAGQKDTGFTFDPRRGKFLEPGKQSGSMMASVPNLPGTSAGAGTVRNVDELIQAASKPEVMSRLRRGEYLGGWNPEGAGVGLDPSRRYLTDLGALRSGMKTDQMGGFSLLRQRGYDVNKSELNKARLKFLAGAGAATGLGTGAASLTEPGREFLGGLVKGERDTESAAESAGRIGRGLLMAGVLPIGGGAAKNVSKLAKAASNAGVDTADALAGVTRATKSPAVLSPIDELLAATKNATGETGTNPSDLSKKITSKLESLVKKETVTQKNGKTKEVQRLVFGDDTKTAYPEELKQLGLQPIQGYNYMSTGTDILNLPEPVVLETLKNNIRAMVGKGGARDFYIDVNGALRSSTGGKLADEQLGGAFAPFSAGTAVPKNAVQQRRFVENPELFPGRMPGEGSLAAGGAWKMALRSATNENPLDPFNFSKEGKLIKIGSFADNTALPTTSQRATIDRHAVQAAMALRPIKDDILPDLSDERVYRLFERAYQEVAAEIGVLPNELQSEVWDIWRRLMVKNPGSSSPSGFFLPTTPSDLWKLSPDQRKVKLLDALSKAGKDEGFLRDAGLL